MGLVVKRMVEYQTRYGLGGEENDWIPDAFWAWW